MPQTVPGDAMAAAPPDPSRGPPTVLLVELHTRKTKARQIRGLLPLSVVQATSDYDERRIQGDDVSMASDSKSSVHDEATGGIPSGMMRLVGPIPKTRHRH